MKARHFSRIVVIFVVTFAVFVLGLTWLNISSPIRASENQSVEIRRDSSTYFEENKGQFHKTARYMARGINGYSLFLTGTDAVYVVPNQGERTANADLNILGVRRPSVGPELLTSTKAVAVYMSLVGATHNGEVSGLHLLPHRTNYFKGGDASRWQTNIPNYQVVAANQVYEGIDMIWYGTENGSAQYEFVMQPQANLDQIEWDVLGAMDVKLTDNGDLLIQTEFGDIPLKRPSTFQENAGIRTERKGAFLIETAPTVDGASQKRFRIKLGLASRETDDLTVAPSVNLNRLAFSTYLGGSSSEWGKTIQVDAAGDVYVAGQTGSIAFPTTPGVFNTTQNGSHSDVFVLKLNAAGSSLVYSTYIGGAYPDEANAITVDSAGNVYVTGQTRDVSATLNFPTTLGAFDTTHNGLNDVFVTKLNTTGSVLLYSTFLGGSDGDVATGIAIDPAGNAYVVGSSFDGANDFPTTPGAFDSMQNGFQDAFVTKLNSTGSKLVYSTFIGSEGHEGGQEVAVDASGSIVICGQTYQNGIFPTTPGAYDRSANGNYDIFVTRFNPEGSALVYSTLIGGSAYDVPLGLGLDQTGSVFLTGETTSFDYPISNEPYDPTFNGGPYDAFVTKLDASGSALKYSTYLGGEGADVGTGIVVDLAGNAFVSGETTDSVDFDFPTTSDGFDTTHNGNRDGFVTKVNANGTEVLYSTFFGGNMDDGVSALTLDAAGSLVLTGYAHSGFPTTAGAFDPTYNNIGDVFVAKLGITSAWKTVFDYDGDGKSDISLWRGSNGIWYVGRSGKGDMYVQPWGVTGDTIVPADYDGDGKTDLAVRRPSDDNFYIFNSSDSTLEVRNFGIVGDISIPSDYNGDGKADVAVWRPSNGTWYLSLSGSGIFYVMPWGLASDKPAPGDFDGDGKTELVVFRPSDGKWYTFSTVTGTISVTEWGVNGDQPVQGDYNGDGRVDFAVYRPSNNTWYRQNSSDGAVATTQWGLPNDFPVPGDYDGDGKIDVAVWRPSDATWYVNRSTAGMFTQSFGLNGDTPTPSAFVF